MDRRNVTPTKPQTVNNPATLAVTNLTLSLLLLILQHGSIIAAVQSVAHTAPPIGHLLQLYNNLPVPASTGLGVHLCCYVQSEALRGGGRAG